MQEPIAFFSSFSPTVMGAVLACLAGLAVGLCVAWLLNRQFIRELAGFFGESFTDPRGRADGKQLSLWAVTMYVGAIVVRGCLTDKWQPAVLWPLLTYLAAGHGFNMYENTKKIKAEADVQQAGLTGQPVPGPTPTATTTTNVETTTQTD